MPNYRIFVAPREREFEGVNLTNITNGSQSNRDTRRHHPPYPLKLMPLRGVFADYAIVEVWVSTRIPNGAD